MTSIYNSTTTTLLVDTTSTRKIVFLPVASTVGAGRLLWIKDISGNAATSSIFISTIGMDRIENRFAPSTLFAVVSSSYGSVMMTTDGILNWYFLQHYYRNIVIPPPPPFNPASVSQTLIAWFKADAGLSVTGSTPTAWVNYGTNAANATFSGTCTTTTINGLTAISFGTSAYATFTLTNSSQARSFFAVFKYTSTVVIGGGPYPILRQGTSSGNWWVQQYTNYSPYSYGYTSYAYFMDFHIFFGYNTPNPTNLLTCLGMVNAASSANNVVIINGTNYTGNNGNTGAAYYSTGAITSYLSNHPNMTMIICEVLVYNGAVTSPEATAISTYLRTKWGV
jgi:hypothetical protein